MKELNLIGLERSQAQELANKLNEILANYQLYYQNLRAFHWNVKGKDFFELHAKFEELYLDSQDKIDLIAERILTLGFKPFDSFSTYLSHATIKEAKNSNNGAENVSITLEGLKVLLQKERAALELAGSLNDEGSLSMLSDFITEQEKTAWMLHSWLS